MEPDDLFLHTVADLERRVAAALPVSQPGAGPPTGEQEYNALMIAPLLRKLLLDSRPLVDVANRQRGARVRYPVDGWPIVAGSLGDGPRGQDASLTQVISGEFASGEGPMTRDQMLATVVMFWNGYLVTAGQLIRHVANVDGGVTWMSLEPTAGERCAIWGNVAMEGQTVPMTCLVTIGRVVLRASVIFELLSRKR